MAETKDIDILKRQDYVDHIKNILSTLSQNKKNCAFALNGEWGSGKTFVLNMLEEQIKDDYLVIRYNAWENDFYEEPLIAILYTFANKLNELQKTDNIVKGLSKELLGKIANGFLSIVGQIIKTKTGVDVVELGRQGLKKAKEFKKHIKELENNIDTSFDQNANLQVIKKQIITGLRDLAEKCPIVVLVDELDRCLPEYAIKVLERLHHVFNDVANLQVILSIDKDQLSNAVAKIYNLSNLKEGATKNQKYERSYLDYIDSYYKKFFSFEIYLNEGNLDKEKYDERIAEYKNHFTPNPTIKDTDVTDYLEMLYEAFNIREKINIIDKANLIHNLIVLPDVELDISYMYMEILLVAKQEQKIKKFEPKTYSHDDFGAVINYNDYFNILEHKMSENMNYANGRVRQNMNGIGYLFALTDLWCYLWFALLIPIDHSIWGIMDCNNIKEYVDHFKKFSNLLKAIK